MWNSSKVIWKNNIWAPLKTLHSSFRRKPESSIFKGLWIPTFVGMTFLEVPICLLTLLCLLSSCGKDYVTGKDVYNLYPISTDVELGQGVMQQQLKELKKNKKKTDLEASPEEYRRIRRIAQRIAAVSHVSKFPYEAHLADVDIVNAWCAPGGKIMVYTGLWDKKKGLVKEGDEDELAAVIGHEVAHATARHVTESISQQVSLQVAGAVATSAIAGAGAGDGADLFQKVFSEGMNVYLPSYSRKNESEADAIGIMYMAMAGYDPRAAVRLWERAAKAKKDEKTSISASHPASGERAKKLKELLPKALEIYNAVGLAPR